MIHTKLFEVRDANTFIPCIAIKMESLPFLNEDTTAEQYVLRRGGFTRPSLFLFGGLNGLELGYNPGEWATRTMQVAHDWIEANWDLLKSGDVIDVEHILGETSEQKVSERVAP